MDKWKIVLILVLAVVLLHILIIKIFIIGNTDNPPVAKPADTVQKADNDNIPSIPEPVLPKRQRKK